MALAVQMETRVGRGVAALAKGWAILGGILLVALSLMTVVSIIGRALTGYGLGPVPGDYELVANGCAIAIFAFLPWCQLRRGHVTVDIFINRLSSRAIAVFGFLGDVLVLAVSAVIARQLYFGWGEKFPYGSDALRDALGMGFKPFFAETTYELQIPVWMPYTAALIGAALMVIVAAYTVWRSLNWVIDGQEPQL
ncbi:TRAP transporter small permease [Cognatishimia sp. MH4019]|uniref:TRAP transporter small permease n=1 Tax=Cognatishimia sp. MH4019 TaxID=2854030 RepID=UPI001CD4F569|nr:TRAP transporter small permease [Cognatishimia sp. MH4019]